MHTVPDQTGKRFVITGANAGTRKEAARRIAAVGGAVIMAVRTPSKAEAAKAEILADHPGAALDVRQLDLADLSGVRAFAEPLLADGTPIDVLVNSAGVLMPPPKRTLTADGSELQFGTSFLGPFALTVLPLPRILQSAAPRVTTKTSLMANGGRIRFDDLQRPERCKGRAAYAQSIAGRHADGDAAGRGRGQPLLPTIARSGFTRVNLKAADGCPGLDASQPGQPGKRTRIPPMNVTQGAEPLIFAAAGPAAEQGAYYGLRSPPTIRSVMARRTVTE
jgi:hypothetical protein